MNAVVSLLTMVAGFAILFVSIYYIEKPTATKLFKAIMCGTSRYYMNYYDKFENSLCKQKEYQNLTPF